MAPAQQSPSAAQGLFARLDAGLTFLERGCVGVAMAAATLVLGANVLLRYIFSAPISWAEELSILLVIWSVFIGSSAIMRARGHLAVDLLPQTLPARLRPLLSILIGGIVIAFLITLVWYGGTHTANVYRTGQIMPMLGLPAWLSYAAVPCGATLMGLRATQILIADLSGQPAPAPQHHTLDG
ncbi:MAG: TRAP transporter small permease [Qingshengfaniella sp.]